MALSTVAPVILLKSGLSRNSSPCEAPGSITEHMANRMRMMNSAGIITLENFSIPLFTPRITMTWVTTMKAIIQRSDFQGLLTKSAKMVGKSLAVFPSKKLAMASVVYSAVHPATTE